MTVSMRRRALWGPLVAALTMLAVVITPVAASAASARAASAPAALAPAGQPVPPNDSHYCDGCAPPLLYSGGPIADTTPAAGMTITPIYWIPSTTTQFPAGYQSVINGYIANVAAASGSTTNVYSVSNQYYSLAGTTKSFLRYRYTAGTPIVDTQPFPVSGCAPVAGYTNCITDAQLRTELTRLKNTKGLVADRSHFYPLFTAPTVETIDDASGLTSASGYCGYHRHFGTAPNQFFYGNEVYEALGCGEGQSPNNNIPADSAISTLSHEISEHVTDPDSDNQAWVDANGAEIGDICADDYGHPLGSTNPADPQDTEYNQLINGGKYYTQTEFSNSAFAALGAGFGCQQSSATSIKPPPDPKAPAEVFIDATPNAVNADGAATSLIEVAVSNQDNSATVGDHIQFSEYLVSGSGGCGTMSQVSGITDADGRISATYTSSTSDGVCAVVAKDALAGKAATVQIYQGTTQALAPTAADTFPTAMIANGQPVTFTTTFGNPGAAPIVNPVVSLILFPGASTTNLDASQVQLSVSTTGPAGPFTPIPLVGSTIDDGAITAATQRMPLPTIAAHTTLTLTYHLAIAQGAAGGTTPTDLLALESYLEQLNPAAGTVTTLADTFATEVFVSDPPNNQALALDGSGAAFGTSSATAKLSSANCGDLIVALVSAGGPSGSRQTAVVTGGGLTWSLVRRTNTQAGTAEVWVARSSGVLTKARITATAARSGHGVYLVVAAYRNAHGVGASVGATGVSGAPSAALTTNFAESYVVAVGNDPTAAKPRTVGSNQKLLQEATVSGNSYWVQARTAATPFAGASVRINDTAPTHDRWNLTVISLH